MIDRDCPGELGAGGLRMPMINARTSIFLTFALTLAVALATDSVSAQGPPTRFFGTVTVGGARPPAGTVVQGFVNGNLCGEGEVRELGAPVGVGYVLDVLGDAFRQGCGTDGARVTFTVGGLDANETGEFRTGTFVQLDLTASGTPASPPPAASPPPGATPAPSPTAAPPSPTAAPTAPPTPEASPTPAASPSPTAAPSPGPSPSPQASPSPEGSPSPTPAGTPTPAPSPSADATPSPGASPSVSPSPSPGDTTIVATGEDDDDGGVPVAAWLLPLIVLLAAGGAGYALWQRRRRGA